MSLKFFRRALGSLMVLPLILSGARIYAQDAKGGAMAAQAGSAVVGMGATIFASANAPACFSPEPSKQACTFMAIGIAGAAAASILGGLNGGAASGLDGGNFGDPGSYDFSAPDFSSPELENSDACKADPSLCTVDGSLAAQQKMIQDLKNKLNDGSLGDAAGNIGGILSAVDSGDLDQISAAMNGADPSALAALGEALPSGAALTDPSTGNVDFSGAEMLADNAVDAGASGASTANKHIDGSLVDVEWNGMLDMLDRNTGKSLTIWQRATRRYQGGPKGKRALMMARFEHIRKTALAQRKSQKGTPVALRKGSEKNRGPSEAKSLPEQK